MKGVGEGAVTMRSFFSLFWIKINWSSDTFVFIWAHADTNVTAMCAPGLCVVWKSASMSILRRHTCHVLSDMVHFAAA